MIESSLPEFGMAGIFISYLIYDRTVLLKGFQATLKELIQGIHRLENLHELGIKAQSI